MELTHSEAVAYPVIYAPDYGFGRQTGNREHDHLWSDVYRIMQDWSDDRKDWNLGCVMGWVHKHELDVYSADDEVENLALVMIYKSGVRAWVAGSDKLWMVARTEGHIELHGRPMGEYQPEECLCTDCIETYEYVLCEDCIRALDDEVLEAISISQEKVRKRELAEARGDMLAKEVMTDAQLDAQLVKEQEVVIDCLSQLATPIVVRQILEDIGTLMCMSGLDDEVTERPMLFTSDRQGRTDNMQIFLEEIGKVVDVRVTPF
jgi:hypothetical protein